MKIQFEIRGSTAMDVGQEVLVAFRDTASGGVTELLKGFFPDLGVLVSRFRARGTDVEVLLTEEHIRLRGSVSRTLWEKMGLPLSAKRPRKVLA